MIRQHFRHRNEKQRIVAQSAAAIVLFVGRCCIIPRGKALMLRLASAATGPVMQKPEAQASGFCGQYRLA
ncbi:hypothetical protein GCM10011419_20820 [Vogesella fluminis]|uniref:Uncharacterized protein n=1 Tax=Vogesella fluminis TaxID=1069161 RepID=A0ABQ3HEH7_9NEIS|nr:hypothetical protein GCM10011419_20820 [Vogesella fluminis]